ncbi:MAG: nitrous oxide reductase accessory protein NosL [Firmicutes bacterium]|nr:nitrous oxide reductase accessory protein NosL [Bacillota bacterium]
MKPRALLFLFAAALLLAGPQAPTPKGACAVCGMDVAPYPAWASCVVFKDGAMSWFDGPKDLFTFLTDMKQYAPRRKAEDVTAIQVKEYYHLKSVDAHRAFYVIGSDVMGPMGAELVPFASEADAKEFMRDHHGKKILTFKEITAHVLKELD